MQPHRHIIWQLTDKKRGHENQSRGLVNAIKNLTASESYLLDVTGISFINFLFNYFPLGAPLPLPDLIVGAGRKSQLALIVAKRCFGGKTICLMKPSLPLSWFDLCVIPKHDKPRLDKNIFLTVGVINTITPKKNNHSKLGTILIGGPSKHHGWNSQEVIRQITSIINSNRQIVWKITNSRRTPLELTTMLKTNQQLAKLFRSYDYSDSEWLEVYLPKCEKIWVTEDSVSMIYEALSTEAEVGLISVPKKRITRISKIGENLIESGLVRSLSNPRLAKKVTLNEAKRTASYIVDKWLDTDE